MLAPLLAIVDLPYLELIEVSFNLFVYSFLVLAPPAPPKLLFNVLLFNYYCPWSGIFTGSGRGLFGLCEVSGCG